jgi:DNA invertase Pin-like site-specific DNA recombinase
MTLAYSYIRFSRPEQLRGDSLRRQLENARKWASARGLVLDDSLRDLGVSAYRGKNRTEGALAGFLRLVEEGKVARGSYLIVESLDRLSRETVVDVLPRFLALIAAGVIIVTLTDGQEYSSERLAADTSPLFISLVVMTRAHEESRTKSKRLSEAWVTKRAAAADNKVVTARVPAWLKVIVENGVKKVVEIPKRAEIIQLIFHRSIQGHGKYAIARDLNLAKEPAFQAEAWQPSYIAKVLSNRAVVGEFQAHAFGDDGKRRPVGDPIPGYYPIVIDETMFQRANAARERRNLSGGRHGTTIVPLLRGLVRCAACGGRMAQINKGPGAKGGRYFGCSDLRRGLACVNDRVWSLPDVEDRVVGYIGSNLAKVLEPPRVAEGPTVADIEMSIASEERARENLLDLVEKGDAGAQDRYLKRVAKIAELRKEMAALRRQGHRSAADPTALERQAAFAALRARLADGERDNGELRTALSQEIRSMVGKIILSRFDIMLLRRQPPVMHGIKAPVGRLLVYTENPELLAEYEAEASNDRDDDRDGSPLRLANGGLGTRRATT